MGCGMRLGLVVFVVGVGDKGGRLCCDGGVGGVWDGIM